MIPYKGTRTATYRESPCTAKGEMQTAGIGQHLWLGREICEGTVHEGSMGTNWLLCRTPGDKQVQTSYLASGGESHQHCLSTKVMGLWWNVTTRGTPPDVCPILPAVPGTSGSSEAVRASFGISFFLTLESHSFSVLMLMKDTSPFAPVITPSCSQRTMRSISSPSFHLRYLPTNNPAGYF